jgi:putative hydrolase of the HAD superfamily
MKRVRAVIFDLDNVLVDEEVYKRAAYHDIARFLSAKCQVSEAKVYHRLVVESKRRGSMYPRLFNDLLAWLGVDETCLPNLVKLYAEADAPLVFKPGVESVLKALKACGVKLALVTNGTVAAQQNKVKRLGAEAYFDVVVYAREKGPECEKPSAAPYREVLERLGINASEAVCVGDNPYTDFYGARQLGIRTVRVLQGEFKSVRLTPDYEADIDVCSLRKFYCLYKADFAGES